jgi:hypothetical protein
MNVYRIIAPIPKCKLPVGSLISPNLPLPVAHVPKYGEVHSATPDEVKEILKKGLISPY